MSRGFVCFAPLTRDPWLDPLRGDARFTGVLREAQTRHQEALDAFVAAGGDRVLGLSYGRAV